MEKIIFEFYNKDDQEYTLESAWATKVGVNYKLENILFYAPEYSWGDIVKVEDRNGELYVTGLIEESGHSTVRIIFYSKENVQPTVESLGKMGCDTETSNIPTLISVDIPPDIDYRKIKRFLVEGQDNDKWSYQESCIAHNIS